MYSVKMKLLILLIACFTKANANEMKSATTNTVQLPQKQEVIYPESHQQTYVPVQIMQKPLFFPQQPTMVIIAQPAFVPQNFLYGNPAMAQQQLLNYFHGNPQARYQFLYGGYQPHPTIQPYVAQNHLGSSSAPTYQILPHPGNNLIQSYGQPAQIAQVNQVPVPFPNPIRSVPPIITGFENFTPEQQVQIKAQLSAALGAPLATSAPVITTTPQTVPQLQDKNSQQSTSFTPSMMYQYNKELKLEKRSTCAITLNPNLTRDQLLDVLVKCFEGNPEALAKIPPLASKHKCVGTLRQIILCIIRNRGNLDANDWNVLLDILKLVTQCTRVIVSNVGNLTGIPYLQELLHCLGDFFELTFEDRSTCGIVLNTSLTGDQIMDVLVKCFESNEEALLKIRLQAYKYKCTGILAQIIFCIIGNRRNLTSNDWNGNTEVFKLIKPCTREIVVSTGSLAGIPYLEEFVHCLGDLFGV
ncbi:hypothetical protein FQR65_LT04390 [Abscondita terminalis]|nr:hypothetical protein FQR65_LT04390 [Abscondita terminalis]